jgi:dihydrofolate reductase
MEIALIAVLDKNNGIGKDNKLLCHLPADLKRFKQLTTDHTIVMGRKTFESLPNGPLPNRRNIILTRNRNFLADGAETANSIDEIYKLCKTKEKIFVIGGEEIYKLFIEKAALLHITRIDHQFEADAFFPKFSNDDWEITNQTNHKTDEKNKYPYSFIDYRKRN